MAWNQISIMLRPNGWDSEELTDRTATTADGSSAKIVRSVPAEGGDTASVLRAPIGDWLVQNGFAYEPDSDNRLSRGEIKLGKMIEPEISIFLSGSVDDLSGVLVRFGLSRLAPEQLERWYGFVKELADTWRLEICAEGRRAPPSEFFVIVTSDPKWQEFREQFGWDT